MALLRKIRGKRVSQRVDGILLNSFVVLRPTLTDFNGAPAPLDPAQPFEALLLVGGVQNAARFRPGPFKGGDAVVIQALRRLQSRLLAAPDLALPPPEPTSRLLARLQDALNAGDADAAWRTLGILGDELRLDSLNMAGLELQILAATGQWATIRWHPRFEALAYGAPSPATAEVLLEAVYRTILERDDSVALPILDPSTASMVDALLRSQTGGPRQHSRSSVVGDCRFACDR